MRASLKLAPLLSRVRRHLGGNAEYKAHATRSWVLHPDETATIQPAIFDADELQKITAFAPGDGREIELIRAAGGPGFHHATTAYELSDVLLSAGHVFTPRVHHPIANHRAPLFPNPPTREFDHAVMISTYYGIRYFGHWMADDLPMLMAARDIGEPVSVTRRMSPAQAGYLDLLGLDTPALEDAYFKKLVLIDDAGQNSHKRARFERLRQLAVPHGTQPAPAGVMLLRGTGGSSRVLTNEAEVAEFARSRGFLVLDPTQADAGQLLRACAGAKVVLGVEGSHLTNGMLWMSQHGTMVLIQPPDRFHMILKNWCDCIGIRTAFMVGEGEASGGFRADTSALARLLDRVAD